MVLAWLGVPTDIVADGVARGRAQALQKAKSGAFSAPQVEQATIAFLGAFFVLRRPLILA
jgi:hypothetical protein